MRKLLFVALLTLPAVAIAAEPSLFELEKTIQFHQTEATRLENQAHVMLESSKASPANKFLNTKFPDSSAAPQKIAKQSATAKKDAERMLAQAQEHKQIASNLEAEATTIRAQMKSSK